MTLITKASVGVIGLWLSGLASAQVSNGFIVFQAAEPAAPPLPVPTLGVLAAVLLGIVCLVMALRALHQNRQTLASFSVMAAAFGGALMLASLGVLYANGGVKVDVTAEDLGQQLPFECPSSPTLGAKETTFSNTTSGSIEVVSIDNPGCAISTLLSDACLTPDNDNGPTTLAPGESCVVAASPQR